MRQAVTAVLTRQDYWIIYIAVVVATLPAVLPVAVSIFAYDLGFGVERAGFIASANMASILVGVLACFFLVSRYSQRTLLLAGLTVMCAGHLMTAGSEQFNSIILTRVFSGLGEGVASSVCYRVMGESRQPARAIAIYAGGQAIVGAIGMGVSATLIGVLGWESLFVVLCVIAIPAIWAASWLGNMTSSSNEPRGNWPVSGASWAVWANCLGIFLFFTGLGGFFAFFAVIGANQGIPSSSVVSALAISSVAGLLGSGAAALMAERVPGWTAIVFGAALLAVATVALCFAEQAMLFASAVGAIMFGWYWTYPYMFQRLSAVDESRRALNLVPAITGAGLALGPLVAGFCIQHGIAVLSSLVLACVLAAAMLCLGASNSLKPVDRAPV